MSYTHRALPKSYAKATGRASALAVVLLGGCTQLPPLPQAPTVLSTPNVALISNPPYRIRVGDELAIKMPLNPELNETVGVLPDGTISTAVVHRQVVAGWTLQQLDAALKRDYGSILKNPEVSVVVTKSASVPVYILGEVERPGKYDFHGSTPRLAQAIAVAGGLKLSADRNHIFILRHLSNDDQKFFATKFSALKSGRDPNANVPLRYDDEIFVPRTGIARVYGYFHQYIQQFVSTSASVNYDINANGLNNNSNGLTH